ncbi:RNA-binding domain-containing protein [Rhodofomes roseus]|uniref:RNA-binding domain-containing protein n=1 Tax=Rhodofomes roseus TaxID=34475 RepID=A0ABQ8K8C7_9APHY|nr:RNA-binding domain-containing protein [Rhodofomes roseus]KAH9833317.1 RNA-binding domain-containing protein [Rhodofomes roseus]
MQRSTKPYSRPTARPRGADGEWLHDMAPEGRRGPRAASKSVNMDAPSSATKLMVSNMHYELTAKDLTQIFGQAGTLVREPLIRYDRSGRSSGIAIVTYETPAEAAAAKSRFDGKLAKGQPMSITFYQPAPPPRTTKGTGAPTSLIHRIEKAPLLDRLSGAPKSQPARNGTGPIRTKAPRPTRVPKKPKTQNELDAELDAFMNADIQAVKPSEAPAAAADPQNGDVEMV